jgi:hypothetical protein
LAPTEAMFIAALLVFALNAWEIVKILLPLNPLGEQASMETGKPTIIRLSAIKNLRNLLFSCIGAAAGYWMFHQTAIEIEAAPQINSPWVVHGVGLLMLVLSCLVFVVCIALLFSSKPGLVLNERGLDDQSSAVSAGFLPWSDIAETRIWQYRNQRSLYIILKNPDKYVAACGPVKRTLLRLLKNVIPSPVAISANSLSISFDQLVSLVNDYLLASRQGG